MLKTKIKFNNNKWVETEINLKDLAISNIINLDEDKKEVVIQYSSGHNITIKGNYNEIKNSWELYRKNLK